MTTIKQEIEKFASECREARNKGETIPIWCGANLRDADLSGADLSDVYLRGADLRRADLNGADLRDADLRRADLSGADLRGASLRGANLHGADLSGADLRRADLCGADLSDVYLRDADLRRADLSDANLSDVYLRRADLSGADLRGASLRGANLHGADLSGALVAGGVVSAHATGEDGGYRWHALHTDEGVVLQYGCEQHPLATWQARGPEYGACHGHDEAHWAIGPAIAIAAAEALNTKTAPPGAKEPQ